MRARARIGAPETSTSICARSRRALAECSRTAWSSSASAFAWASVASASAIWRRVETSFDPFHHDTVLAARAPKFKRAGLSRPKIKTFRGVARAVKDGKLAISKTPNGENPLVHGATPILGVDVWEHSYYIDYRNARPKYLEAFVDSLINWDYVLELYEKA